MGHEAPFPAPQKTWVDSTIAEYKHKLRWGKPWTPGQPEPEDDTDTTAWVNQKCAEWEILFKNELTAMLPSVVESLRSSLRKRFSNEKSRFKAKVEIHRARETAIYIQHGGRPFAGSSVSAPSALFPLTTPKSPSGRQLFAEEAKGNINAVVREERRLSGLGPQVHVGMLQAAIKKEWESADKNKWNSLAQSKARESQSKDAASIYSNQEIFVDCMRELMTSVVGSGSQQIGNAVFHFLYSFRNKDETLKTGAIDVMINTDDPTFSTYFPEYATTIVPAWSKFAEAHVPRNRSSQTAVLRSEAQQQFVCTPDDLPSFPLDISESRLHPGFLKELLKHFLQAQWDYLCAQKVHSATDPSINTSDRGIPWDHVDYALQLPAGLHLSDPGTLTPSLLFQLYEFFVAQAQPFQLFKCVHTYGPVQGGTSTEDCPADSSDAQGMDGIMGTPSSRKRGLSTSDMNVFAMPKKDKAKFVQTVPPFPDPPSPATMPLSSRQAGIAPADPAIMESKIAKKTRKKRTPGRNAATSDALPMVRRSRQIPCDEASKPVTQMQIPEVVYGEDGKPLEKSRGYAWIE